MHPPLTTLAQDKPGLGVAAARALLRQVDGADTAEPVTLPVELVVRDSTATVGG
jgi:LacI family transcriptional regulator